jgi:hypothetical protein
MFSALFGKPLLSKSLFVDLSLRGDAVTAIFCSRAFASRHHQSLGETH